MRWRDQWEMVQESDIGALTLGCLGDWQGRVVAAVVAVAATVAESCC